MTSGFIAWRCVLYTLPYTSVRCTKAFSSAVMRQGVQISFVFAALEQRGVGVTKAVETRRGRPVCGPRCGCRRAARVGHDALCCSNLI